MDNLSESDQVVHMTKALVQSMKLSISERDQAIKDINANDKYSSKVSEKPINGKAVIAKAICCASTIIEQLSL